MAGCSALTGKGERCRGIAKAGCDWCPAHDPARVGARRRAASKAAKSKPGRELQDIKANLNAVLESVRTGAIERGVGAVLFQGYNVLLKAVETERKAREQEELVERLEELEARIA